MTPDESNDDLGRLWRSQADNLREVSLDIVRMRARTMERRVSRRNLGEYAAAAVVVVLLIPRMLTATNGVLVAAGGVLLAGIAYVLYRIYVFGSARTMPADLAFRSCIEFQRAELERQRDLLQNIWTWYVLPLWPGMGLILIGQTLEHPERWPVALGVAVLTVLMGFQIAWMNKRSAKTLQEMIDRLEENPMAALRTDPPSPTFAQRLSVWVTTSFLGAAVVLFVVQQFLPEVKAALLDVVGLPAATSNAVVVLLLLLAGVAVQAGWWIIRRR